MSRPSRLAHFSYVGMHRYFLTFCTRHRRECFTDTDLASEVLSQIRRAATLEGFAIVAYCFMPDHLHLLVEATHDAADLCRFAKLAKQRSGAAFALKCGGPLWQEGYYDRVLRGDDDVKAIAKYIIENPVRGGLVSLVTEYRYCGSDRWSLAELLAVYEQ